MYTQEQVSAVVAGDLDECIRKQTSKQGSARGEGTLSHGYVHACSVTGLLGPGCLLPPSEAMVGEDSGGTSLRHEELTVVGHQACLQLLYHYGAISLAGAAFMSKAVPLHQYLEPTTQSNSLIVSMCSSHCSTRVLLDESHDPATAALPLWWLVAYRTAVSQLADLASPSLRGSRRRGCR